MASKDFVMYKLLTITEDLTVQDVSQCDCVRPNRKAAFTQETSLVWPALCQTTVLDTCSSSFHYHAAQDIPNNQVPFVISLKTSHYHAKLTV